MKRLKIKHVKFYKFFFILFFSQYFLFLFYVFQKLFNADKRFFYKMSKSHLRSPQHYKRMAYEKHTALCCMLIYSSKIAI